MSLSDGKDSATHYGNRATAAEAFANEPFFEDGEKRYHQRTEIILLSLEGKTLDEIISTTGMSKPIVNKWRQRFRTKE